jgi:hypothetical protein
MTLREQLRAEYRARGQSASRDTETTLGGTTVSLGDSQTFQAVEDSYLGSSELRGIPRGRDAIQAREIAETAPFQLILNAINDQLLGGEVAFPSDDADEDQSEAELKALVGDVLDGPHHGGADFDDLITAWTTDMAVLGTAYGEVIPPESGDLPAG